MSFDVCVVGGGILGAATAYRLALAGARTVLLERGGFGQEASGLNAGTLNLVHEKPGNFVDVPFRLAALEGWRTLAEELDEDLEATVDAGAMIVAESEPEAERLGELRSGYDDAGVPVDLVEGTALRAFAPFLAPGVPAALFCPRGGHADPGRAGPALARAAGRLGAALRPGTAAIRLVRDGAGWRIGSHDDVVVAACVVVTAGPWSAALLAPFGMTLPLRVRFFQACTTVPAPRFLPCGVRRISGGLTLKQVGSGACVVGGGWLGDSRFPQAGRLRPETLAQNRAVAAAVVPGVAALPVAAEWGGYDGSSVSGRPILAAVPGAPGLFVSTGANEGFCHGPLLGAMTASRVLGQGWAGPEPVWEAAVPN